MIKVNKLRMAGFLKYFNCDFIKAEKDTENNQRLVFYFKDDERTMKFVDIYNTRRKGKEKGKKYKLPDFEKNHFSFNVNGRKKTVTVRNQVLQGYLIVIGGIIPIDLIGDNGEVMIFRDNEKIRFLISLFYKTFDKESRVTNE